MAISPAMFAEPDELELGAPMPKMGASKENPFNVEVVPDGTETGLEGPDDYGGVTEDTPVEHRANLAEMLDENELEKISSELIELYEADNSTRADWMDSYTKGLDYLGFKGEDRTEPFKGASGVYHPVLTEAVVRFQSNAIIEIFPAAGPVLTKIMGDQDDPAKVALSKRVKEELNYQLTENMAEYRNETEQSLFRLPLAGSVFKKVYYDQLKKRPSSCMVPAEDFVVDYGSSELENTERYTHVQRKSANQVKKLQRSGFYRQVKLPKPGFNQTAQGKEKEDEIMGREPSAQAENRYTLLEVHCYYNLPGDFADLDDVADPYIITIEKESNKVLSIYRNWAEQDKDRNPEQYFVHYQYMPGLGFYGIGLIHLLGSIAKAATSILRQLIDAGTLSNLPGGLKTRGLRSKNDDTPIAPGEWRDVDVAAGTIQQNLFPMPYKEPSSTLVALLDKLVEEGRRVGSIADVEVGQLSQNAPVGTTLALLERSLMVMSAVHARLHASLRREFKLIGKCIFDYMSEKYDWDDTGQFNRREDFDGRVDILPVSDPNASTQAMKIIQMQSVAQLAAQNPELYDIKELHTQALHAFGIRNQERLMPPEKQVPRMDPVQENMSLLNSQPVKVYPDQDHTAHIQVHLSMMTDPKILEMLKASPKAALVQGAFEAHLCEHLAFQYHGEIQQMMGVQLPPIGEEQPPEVEALLSRALADASVRLRELHDAQAKQKLADEVAADPVYQLREREVAVKEQKQKHDAERDRAKHIADLGKTATQEQMDLLEMASKERMKGAEIGANLVTFGAQLEDEERKQGIELGREVIKGIVTEESELTRLMNEAREKEKQREDDWDNAANDRMHEALENRQQRQSDERIAEIQKEAAKAKAANRPKPANKP